jgi:Protein of unknown function (DUF4236)
VGFKFRKRIKLARGLWVNWSKGFPSFSIGKRGFTTNIGKRGVRTTVGISGSGMSYTTKTAKWPAANSSRRVPPADDPLSSDTEDLRKKTLKKIWPLVFAPLCGAVLLLFAIVHGNRLQSRSVVPTGTPELTKAVPTGTPEMISDKAILEPTPEVRQAELVGPPEVRRAQLVATPEVRRAELVATPAHK